MQIAKNKKIFIGALIIFLFFASWIVSIGYTDAQGFEGISASGYLDRIAKKVDIKPDEGKGSVPYIVGTIINGVLGFLGVICLLLIIYAGLKWMLAGGSEEDINTSRQIIKYAIIGVIVIVGSYALSSYVVDKIISSTQRDLDMSGFEGGVRGSVPYESGFPGQQVSFIRGSDIGTPIVVHKNTAKEQGIIHFLQWTERGVCA